MPERSPNGRTLRIGTRGSNLAKWQAEWVANELRQLGREVRLVEIATQGDVDRSRPVGEIGTRGVFTKEIQRALLANKVDIGVHSLKDLPTTPVEGLVLAAVPPREQPFDALISRTGESLPQLSPGARVGTGSLRRKAQLLWLRPELAITEIRGNIETRLRKLDAGEFEAILLAAAGLRRLGLSERITHTLPVEQMLPAVGQGALGIECRSTDPEVIDCLRSLEDVDARAAVTAERVLLEHLEGGCMAPIGAFARRDNDVLRLAAVVLSPDGRQRLHCEEVAAMAEAEELGRRAAQSLLAQGAAGLVAESRKL